MSEKLRVPAPHPHILPLRVYLIVFGLLIGLTLLTVYLAGFDFGRFSVFMTLLIAGAKASLVFAVFMHLWFDSRFYALVISSSLVFLALFILFSLLDEDSRGFVDPVKRNFLPRDEKVYQYTLKNPDALPLRPGLLPPEKDKLIFVAPGHHGSEE